MKRRIIVTDIDRQSSRLLKNLLTAAGYEVTVAPGFGECKTAFTSSPPDILVIDPLYPMKEGIQTVKKLYEYNSCPIIAVSENVSERAITDILDAGADDYIRKPFFPGELLSRVHAAVRRIELVERAKGSDTEKSYVSGELRVDYDSHTVTVSGKNIHLTKNEFKILSLLCRYSGRVLTYDFIIKSVWGPQVSGGNGILRVNVTNLRKKIEQDSSNPLYLFTENGVGYRIAESRAEK